MSSISILNGQCDLKMRDADHLVGGWECCADIIDRHSGAAIGRVYGRGASRLGAERDASLEADSWIRRTSGASGA